jgi:4-diphosphocytidyl-2-C-methyl-D-erythritol kinase
VKISTLQLPSFAKINWSLRILGKRPDGYHELVTVLQTVTLHDELTIQGREDDQILLTCDDPNIPTDRTNLVNRAAQLLRDHLQRSVGASVHLAKRIPTKAGLGGASSNAAVTLLGLNRIWQAGLNHAELMELGSRLGADVPFFFTGGCALGEGIGTIITSQADSPRQPLIIVTPNVSVSTATAYKALKAGSLTTSGSISILSSSFEGPISDDFAQWPLQNDFEGVIFEIEPEIEHVKVALLEAGARGALLAGSGSSVFGTFDNEAARERALKNLKCEAGWRVFRCDTLSRDEYFRAMDSSGFPLFTLS